MIKKQQYMKDLDGVIDTSKTIRDFMLDKDTPLSTKEENIRSMRTAIEANKSIVSSVINIIQLEKLSK